MKYDHIVKVNGEYYPAGTEVPEIKELDEHLIPDRVIAMETEPARRGRPKKES